MTRFEPTLIVTRLIVNRGANAVYDEAFHSGVNVVRGENSSGKSTILNFIFYGLGGDLAEWSEVARLCDRVTVEAKINGRMVTMSREIVAGKNRQPMEIFGGSYEDSKSAPRSDWAKYPYATQGGKESFSLAIFRLMGMPEVSTDASGHITLHQILRLLYADQLSPVEHIFRFEQFDRADLRDTVGRLMCGAYDATIYNNEQKIRELDKEYSEVSGQLKSIFGILGAVEQGFSIEWVQEKRASLLAEYAKLQHDIVQSESTISDASILDSFTLTEQQKAFKQVQDIQEKLGDLHNARSSLTLAMADSDKFISSLDTKVTALTDASKVADYVGEVKFQTCPACYSPIDDFGTTHACHLCKSPFDSEQTKSRISALILDTNLQLKQSALLQTNRAEKGRLLDKQIADTTEIWRTAATRLATLQRLPSSEAREKLRELSRKSGYVQRQIDDIEQKSKLVSVVQELTQRKDFLNNEMGRLKTSNQTLRAQQQDRLARAYEAISAEVKLLLQNDLRRQDIFEDPKTVNFTFADDKILIDNENYFSASSRAILRSSFFLGFMAAATKVSTFRHPRFCMIDTHENMGVEAIRSQNFQLQMLRISKESTVEHQIIYATAMIEPELENDAYTVGAFSRGDEKTVGIRLS